jgi:NAD(P)-dependent dehydrogenase (short-subunit alcohol dehydrogenase family)
MIEVETGRDLANTREFNDTLAHQRVSFCRPQEVAEAIVWLLSDAASYATGAILDIAGGR